MSAPHVSPLEMATLHTYFAGGIGEICMAHVSQVVLAKHALLLCVPLDLAVDVALLPDLACVATLTGEISDAISQMALAKWPPHVAPMHVSPACMAIYV